ncbi:hypothetical protein Pint_12047 [Pistacia integerrima]|uniref:Uncharacterized protein n=1 Tax=Pistacia integerrima TaxID=434235 RepID=A0ACC0XN47_9ROSI|nr:hypothetical protein Pint_12047 [Pistacia integerrima]
MQIHPKLHDQKHDAVHPKLQSKNDAMHLEQQPKNDVMHPNLHPKHLVEVYPWHYIRSSLPKYNWRERMEASTNKKACESLVHENYKRSRL